MVGGLPVKGGVYPPGRKKAPALVFGETEYRHDTVQVQSNLWPWTPEKEGKREERSMVPGIHVTRLTIRNRFWAQLVTLGTHKAGWYCLLKANFHFGK